MSYSLLDTIGNTPLVEIRRLNPNPEVKILAKLEYLNPGGSIKDRTALFMIEDGEKSGMLTPDKTVIEATSGNTGIGLALVCAIKGYKLLLAMSETASLERQMILKARGAELLLTPGHMGTDGALEEVYRLARENPGKYFMADQHNSDANWRAHYFGTAEEIWRQTNGEVSMVVAAMGTTGTLMGVSRRLKEYNSDIRIVGVEPYLGHKIEGLKNIKEAYCPEIFEKRRLDKKVNIDDEDAFEMTRRLAKVEGLFVGMSSGAAMVVAINQAVLMDKGTIVVIFPDGGERYLSTSLFSVKDKVGLKLFNTMSKKKETFEPILQGKVSIYSCGPTAHARMHLGECRRFLFSDLLCSYLEYRGYLVTHIMNITDFDDKTINGSEKAGMGMAEFTEKYIDMFKNDLAALKISPAAKYPRASKYVEQMNELTEKLLDKGFAYEKFRSIYFDISRFPDYGKLSGVDINKIRIGATVDLDDYEKDNPRDFTLLKRCRLSELKRGIYIKTKWGNIRPSWHIQCAAISMKHLGETFDIHTSSRDLVFPHHENELAIAMAVTGKPLANYWVHCDQVMIDGKKADEKGAGITLDDLTGKSDAVLEKERAYSGREIRYWLLSTHYRKPLKFSISRLEDAKRSLNRIDDCINTLLNIQGGNSFSDLKQLLYDIRQGFISAMDDDLNISAALASIFKIIKKLNILANEKRINKRDARKILDAFSQIDSVLKIFDFGDHHFDHDIENLLKERDRARKEKNWNVADNIRDQLKSRGIIVKDQKISTCAVSD